MDSELNFNEENSSYQPFNSTNHLPTSSHHSSEQHHSSQGGINLPRHLLGSAGQRRSASWPYSRTPTEDWSNTSNGASTSRMGSRSASHFSADTSHSSSMYRELEEAKQTILILETKLDTLTQAFSAVVGAVPGLLNVANPFAQRIPLELQDSSLGRTEQNAKPLCQADYPSIRFWHESEWKRYCKEMKAESNDRTIVSDYMENKDGQAVSAGRAREIREVAFTLWFEMINKGRAPAKWSKAAADVRSFYYAGIEEKCPEMRYCHNSWKAQHLATKNYSSFHSHHGHKGPHGGVKQEQADQIIISDPKPQKRSHSDGEEERGDKVPRLKKTKRSHRDKPAVSTLATSAPTGPSTSFGPPHNINGESLPAPAQEMDQIPSDTTPNTVPIVTGNPPPRPQLTISRILFSNPKNAPSTSTNMPPPSSSAPSTTSVDSAESSRDNLTPAAPPPGTGIPMPRASAAENEPTASSEPSLTQAMSGHSPAPSPIPLPNTSETGQEEPQPEPPAEQPMPATTSRKSTRAEPSNAITARNLCKREWLAAHPKGLNAEFATYWGSLKGSTEEARFQQQAREAKAAAAASGGAADSHASSNKGPKTRRSKMV